MRLLAVAPNPSIDRLYELDRLRLGAVNRPLVETRVAGGKGLNVARTAVALGADVVAVVLVAGHAGQWLVDTIAAEGIPGRYAWATGETRTCLAIHDAQTNALTELNEAGPPVSGEAWAGLVAALREELTRGGVGLLTISGSLPPDARTDGLAELASTAASLGIPVALDAGGPALGLALETRPWLVKLNVAEAMATLGDDAPADVDSGPPATVEGSLPASVDDGQPAAVRAARRIAVRTGGAVIVTRGIDGAVAIGPDGGLYRVGPPPILGPFPVGSGDALLAGVASATLRGGSFSEALRLGAAAAVANALTRGAGRLDAAEVERLLSAMRIESVSD
jgi:1-phosphofructokinase family hexose kinase